MAGMTEQDLANIICDAIDIATEPLVKRIRVLEQRCAELEECSTKEAWDATLRGEQSATR